MKNKKENIRAVLIAALFTAVTAVLSQISFMTATGIPISLQIFAIALCGYVLGPVWGAASTFVYILMGAIGLPVFSGFKGGFQTLLGPTGGFILGFLVLAFFCGLPCGGPVKIRLALTAAGLVLCHLMGILVFCFVTGSGFKEGLMAITLPFIIKDIILIIIAQKTAAIIKKRINI